MLLGASWLEAAEPEEWSQPVERRAVPGSCIDYHLFTNADN